jgi:hypothetical protein
MRGVRGPRRADSKLEMLRLAFVGVVVGVGDEVCSYAEWRPRFGGHSLRHIHLIRLVAEPIKWRRRPPQICCARLGQRRLLLGGFATSANRP